MLSQYIQIVAIYYHKYKFDDNDISCVPCVAGSLAYGGGVTLTAALRLVEASLATAMSYITVVWGLILGYLFFSEVLVLRFQHRRMLIYVRSHLGCIHAQSAVFRLVCLRYCV